MRFGALIALIAAALVLVLTARADAYIYWANDGSVARANLDASGAVPIFISGGDASGVAVDENFVYWADDANGQIGRANLDGTDPDPDFISGLAGACGLAVDENYVYWGTPVGGTTIGRADIDGSDVEEDFITGADLPCGVTVDDSFVYWSNFGETPGFGQTIGRAELDGDSPNQSFITAGGIGTAPCGVAVNPDSVFFGYRLSGGLGGTTIGRADIDGTDLDPSFITGATTPCMGAVDANYVYWVNNFDPGSIGRAELDGDNVQANFISGSTVNLPMFLAVDPFPLPTSLQASCSPASVAVFQAATCTATATDPTGTQSPSGTVGFTSSQGSFGSGGSCSLNPSGPAQSSCSLTYTPSAAGPHAIAASMPANNKFLASSTATSLQGTAISLIDDVTRNRKNGTAQLTVVAPVAGAFTLAGRGVAGTSAQAGGPGELTLRVRATGKSAKKLRRKGRTSVSPTVAFAPPGGPSVTDTTAINLVRRVR